MSIRAGFAHHVPIGTPRKSNRLDARHTSNASEP